MKVGSAFDERGARSEARRPADVLPRQGGRTRPCSLVGAAEATADRNHLLVDRASVTAPTASVGRLAVLIGCLLSVTVLAWHGTIDAQAYVAIVSLVLGGVVHASGTRQGSEATKGEEVR